MQVSDSAVGVFYSLPTSLVHPKKNLDTPVYVISNTVVEMEYPGIQNIFGSKNRPVLYIIHYSMVFLTDRDSVNISLYVVA